MILRKFSEKAWFSLFRKKKGKVSVELISKEDVCEVIELVEREARYSGGEDYMRWVKR